jgi:hypothetical protein
MHRNTAIILFLFTTRAQGTQRSHKELCVTFVPVVPLWWVVKKLRLLKIFFRSNSVIKNPAGWGVKNARSLKIFFRSNSVIKNPVGWGVKNLRLIRE